jgi:hypothetical protein
MTPAEELDDIVNSIEDADAAEVLALANRAAEIVVRLIESGPDDAAATERLAGSGARVYELAAQKIDRGTPEREAASLAASYWGLRAANARLERTVDVDRRTMRSRPAVAGSAPTGGPAAGPLAMAGDKSANDASFSAAPAQSWQGVQRATAGAPGHEVRNDPAAAQSAFTPEP